MTRLDHNSMVITNVINGITLQLNFSQAPGTKMIATKNALIGKIAIHSQLGRTPVAGCCLDAIKFQRIKVSRCTPDLEFL